MIVHLHKHQLILVPKELIDFIRKNCMIVTTYKIDIGGQIIVYMLDYNEYIWVTDDDYIVGNQLPIKATEIEP